MGEVYPQYPGVVMREGEGGRELVGMTWGFPLAMRGKQGQPLKPKAVNNARTDKLATPFWSSAARNPAQRCLIPVTAFAEAVGTPGAMTRTWLSVPDADLFVCAGLWRKSVEWGEVYSMVMTDARPDLLDIHDRMPVILAASDQQTWLQAPLDEAIGLCVPYPSPLAVVHTEERWARQRRS